MSAAIVRNDGNGKHLMGLRLSAVVSVVVLAACGGGGGSGGSGSESGADEGAATGTPTGDGRMSDASVEPVTDLSGSFRFLGFVELIQDDLLERVNRDANFLRLTEPQQADVFRNSVPARVDTCSVSVTTTIPTDVGVIGFPDANFTLVSAGESLTLTGDAGTYATLTLSDSRFEVAPYPPPSSLTLDVPGDDFPAFADVRVLEVMRVRDLRPSRRDPLGADTPISWIATGLPDHTINLEVFDIVASDRVVNLRCHVADDGEFTLPANVVGVLNEQLGAGFELEGLQQNLRTDLLVVQGDALLVVSKSLD